MELEIPYVKVAGLGMLMTDYCIGFNATAKKFFKMALFEGKFRVIESVSRQGPWKLKNDGSRKLNPSRIVNYRYED